MKSKSEILDKHTSWLGDFDSVTDAAIYEAMEEYANQFKPEFFLSNLVAFAIFIIRRN